LNNSKPFSKTRNYRNAKKVQEFMFGDIQKSLELNNKRGIGAPGFLIALGLCCYTEYWGRLALGISTGCSKPAFNTFLDKLDPTHYRTLRESGLNIYHDVRCGLAHSFVIEKGGNIDADTEGDHGIEFDKKTKYSFYVRTYFREFQTAVEEYMMDLVKGNAERSLFNDALKGKPELV